MVGTVVPLRSSAVSTKYFVQDGYYMKHELEHQQASFWYGGAAQALGLRAHVLPSRFESVLSGYVPGEDLRLGRMREGEHVHRPGWDITLSAPKSVSLEALVMGDRRVIRAHDEAVRATLDFVEAELLQTRGWDPATRRRPRVSANGMVVAGFRHLASRDQDPQLHTHCVLANMTRNASGEWRSVEPTKILRSQKLIGAFYRNELARRLQALGMAVSPTLVGRVPGFELAGYERSFLDAFSGRRREILAYLEKKELPHTAENTQKAALRTRRRKEDRTLADLVPAWRARARALGLVREKEALRPPRPLDPLTGERVRVPRVPPPDLPPNEIRSMKRAPALPALPRQPRSGVGERAEARPTGAGFRAPAELSLRPERGVLEAVARAVAHVAERRTTIPEAEIRAVALGHAPGRYTLAQVDAAIARLVRSGALIEVERRGMDRAFVTDRAVKAERRVLAAMRAGRGKGTALANGETVEKRLDGSRLTEGQREAVRTVLLSKDLVIGVQGHAGSGKTTMLRAVKELLGDTRAVDTRAVDRKIQGLAPSAAAARVLAREAGIPTRTLQYFLTRFGDLSDPERLARGRAEYGGAVLAVDEASMIGSVRMEALLRIARELDVARVVLVGDTKQLKSVDAGQPFRLLQKAGMATASMKEVMRQRDPELRAAAGLAREGEPGAAIAALGNRVREAPPEELGPEAGRRWLALAPEHRADTLIFAPTHAVCRQANDTVREGLADEGLLRGRTLAVDRLVNRGLTRVQASDLRSYEPGDTVVFHRDVFGCRANDVCIVMGHDDGRVVLAHPDGERRFRPSGNASRYLGLYDTERIELRAGDRIRWTRNRKAPRARGTHPQAPDLVNGGEAEIVEIGHKRVRFRDGERKFSLALGDPQLRHLDHAYCSTVHSAQGRTARGAIAVLDAGGWVDLELFHVELSRVSEAFLLLTDDRDALIERLEAQDWSEDGALEALGIDLSEPPVVGPEEFAALAADWRALLREGEETNTVPFFLRGYGDAMARAAALAQIEDLPEDMRRFVDTMLAEHEGHLARDREVRNLTGRIQESWRRWPELGWAASAQGLPIEELPQHAAWREEGAALLEAATRLGADGETARRVATHHLHAMPGARAGLEEAVETLERTRLLDDAERFERAWHGLRERAAETGVPELHAPGHWRVAELGERLEAAEGLDARVGRAVAEWREIEAAQAALAEEVSTLPGRIAAWRERRADLPQDEHGGLDPKHPERRTWREEGATLEAAAEDMLRPEDVHAPYLDVEPGQRAAIGQAVEEVGGALRLDRYRALGWLTAEVVRQARENRTRAFHVPRYGEMVAEAQALSGQAELPARTQELVASWLKLHAEFEGIRRQIRDWPERADALAAECPERPATLDSLRDWRQRAEPLLEDARAMLAEDGPHAPHLAAMPGERKALVEATGGLERELLAVEARETKLLAALVQRSLDEFHRDWQAHLAEATAAHVDPFYMPRHEGLIDRLQELRRHPAVEELPERARNWIDSILEQDTCRTEAASHVHEYLDQVQRCRNDYEELKKLANSNRLQLQDVPAFDEWHDTAERLPAAGKAIADDRKTYGPCLDHTPNAWRDVHAGIRELGAALGHDTSSLRHRQPELYLQPITRPLPTRDEAREADASYRRLRDQWHEHMALAEADHVHPYGIQGCAPLIDVMRELRDRSGLDASARNALGTIVAHHGDFQEARADIDHHLDETVRAFRKLQDLKDIAEQFGSLNVQLEEIGSYAEWTEDALELAQRGEAVLADLRRYGIHLKESPGLARRIHADVQRLDAVTGRDTTELHHRQPQLFLDPIARPLPDSRQAGDADTTYRCLRDQWYEHMVLAETDRVHPYEFQGCAPLIDAMRALRDRPGLATDARQALDTLLHDHDHLHRDRQHIHAWPDQAERALEKYQGFKDIVQTLSALDVRLEDIDSYGKWKDSALPLADAGEAILADPERYGIHLKENPGLAQHIHADVQRLNAAIGRDEASIRRERRQSLSEDEKASEHRSQRRGIKF